MAGIRIPNEIEIEFELELELEIKMRLPLEVTDRMPCHDCNGGSQ